MAKDKSDKITRIDVRIPNDIYQKIEQIAIETNQPLHHRSGKPVVTPIILNLLNLGLEATAKEDFNLESLTDKQSGTNRIKEAEIEKKILASLEDKLESLIENKVEVLVENKLSEIINDKLSDRLSNAFVVDSAEAREKIYDFEPIEESEDNVETIEADLISDNINDKISDIKENANIKEENADSEEIFDVEVESVVEDNNQLDNTEDVETEDESEVIEDDLPSPKENKQLTLIEDKSQGQEIPANLNQTELAKRLGYKNHTQVGKKFKQLSKEEFIKWSKEKDPDNYGWYKVGNKFHISVGG